MSRPPRRRVRLEAVEHHGDYDHAPRPIAAMAKAFPEGSSTSVHRHGRGQLLHAVSGVMRIETPYAAWLVPPARALWMPPHEVHRVTMRGHVEMRTLYIEPGANLDGWASRAGASRRTLARLFRGETGLSFAEWRARLRAIDGLARLSTGASVAASAAAVGYGSPSAFSAMVRRLLGEPPRRLARAA
jgi:AraC-like DNA-binding protein